MLSVGNFVLVYFLDEDGKWVLDVDVYFLEWGCVLCLVGNYGLLNVIWMIIGSEEVNCMVIGYFKDFFV